VVELSPHNRKGGEFEPRSDHGSVKPKTGDYSFAMSPAFRRMTGLLDMTLKGLHHDFHRKIKKDYSQKY
jgi:hypothetical protein